MKIFSGTKFFIFLLDCAYTQNKCLSLRWEINKLKQKKIAMNSSFQHLFSAVAVALAMVTMLGCASSQERAERREQTRRMVAEGIAERRLHISVNSMSTLRYGTRMVSSDFYVELRGDTLESYLPYLGQVYRSPVVSTPQGLNFEAPLLDYSESRPSADLTRLELLARTLEDTFLYILDIYSNGKAYIRVRGQNRDAISFDGDCDALR